MLYAYTVVTSGPNFGLANRLHKDVEIACDAADKIRTRSNGATAARVLRVSAKTQAELRCKVRAADFTLYVPIGHE